LPSWSTVSDTASVTDEELASASAIPATTAAIDDGDDNNEVDEDVILSDKKLKASVRPVDSHPLASSASMREAHGSYGLLCSHTPGVDWGGVWEHKKPAKPRATKRLIPKIAVSNEVHKFVSFNPLLEDIQYKNISPY
jgi:hypothetical protein